MTEYISRKCKTCPTLITGHKNKKYCTECYLEQSRKRARDRARCLAAGLGKKDLAGLTRTPEGRKKYSHLYYLAHKDAAKEYQRAYTRKYKKSGAKRTEKTAWQGFKKTVITASDFMNVAAGTTEKVLAAILAGEIGITI